MMIRLAGFKGMAPSIDSSMLADTAASYAFNTRLGYGDVRPIKDVAYVTTATAGAKSLAYFGGAWYASPNFQHLVPTMVQNDAWARIYKTESGVVPQYKAYGGTWYALGLPAPSSAPVATVTGTATSDDPLTAETRAYVFTHVSAYGEEGPPSSPSGVVEVYPGQSVSLSRLVHLSGNYNPGTKRIYRTNSGSSTTEFQYVGEVAHSATTFSDTVSSDSLGEVLASTEHDAPPTDLVGLNVVPGGFLVGFHGKELCFSLPYLPHAWPVSYRVPLEYTILAIATFGNSILIATEGPAYLATGAQPSSMSLEKMETGYACVSKYGMVDMGYACIYPAVNGLMYAAMGDVKLLTEGLITPSDWAALNPSTIRAGMWDGKYVAFWDNAVSKGFIFDPKTGDFCLHNVNGAAVHTRADNGTMYVAYGTSVLAWDSGAALTQTWRSKKFTLPWDANLAVAQIRAGAYPVTLNLYYYMPTAEAQAIAAQRPTVFTVPEAGVLKYSVQVANADTIRLPSGFRYDQFSVEFVGTSSLLGIHLASTAAELAGI